jgi:hypothetical protein
MANLSDFVSVSCKPHMYFNGTKLWRLHSVEIKALAFFRKKKKKKKNKKKKKKKKKK